MPRHCLIIRTTRRHRRRSGRSPQLGPQNAGLRPSGARTPRLWRGRISGDTNRSGSFFATGETVLQRGVSRPQGRGVGQQRPGGGILPSVQLGCARPGASSYSGNSCSYRLGCGGPAQREDLALGLMPRMLTLLFTGEIFGKQCSDLHLRSVAASICGLFPRL